MNGRTLIIGIVVVVGAWVAYGTLRPSGPTPQRRDPLTPQAGRSADVPLPRVRLSPDERPPAEPTPPLRRPAGSAIASDLQPVAPADATKPSLEPKPKSLERLALAHVGADSLAEAIWLDAINDPFLPAQERSDLIEDLNQEGFADPHHLTAGDIPLIVSRLALIEQEAPLAMDETNAAAFAEAYKDLANMHERATATATASAAAVAAEAAAAEAASAEAQAAEHQAETQTSPDGPVPAVE